MNDVKGKSLTIEANKVYVKRDINVTGLKKLTITAFQLVFLKDVTEMFFFQNKPTTMTKVEATRRLGVKGQDGVTGTSGQDGTILDRKILEGSWEKKVDMI